MSLRVRLLLATAVIALLALVAADFVTYSLLRSSLYRQIDTGLELSHRAVEASIGGGAMPAPPQTPGAPSSVCKNFDGLPVAASGLSPGTVIEVRSTTNKTVYRCTLPELGAKTEPLPSLPARITGASEERMRRFVADASHELRTPLAAVRAYAELFDRGAANRPEDLRRVIDGIQSESGRMGHLVEDLLLLAHLDEGRPLRLEPTDLVAVAGDAVTTANALGPQWPAHLVAARPVEVMADALRLRQVFDNLIGNVRVHCPASTAVTVRVSEEGDDAVVSVSDDGPGLSEAHAGRIFERFFRADPSRSREDGGAGLGLAIVAALVRAHGGSVSVSRAAEGGAQFTVRLPKLPVQPDEDSYLALS